MITHLEVAQVLFLESLYLLAVMDYKLRFTHSLCLVPCWVATVMAALQLIGAATLFYAIVLSVLTLVLMLVGITLRTKIGDGDIWIIIGLLWCFAETPYVLVVTAMVTYLLASLWVRRTPQGAPLATCLAIALGIVLPIMLILGIYHF